MVKVGIITFHGAHNYGSSLQAYALQTVIREGLQVPCEIINFRTEVQKDQYRPLTKRKGFKYLLKNCYFLLNYPGRKMKYDLFEIFISSYLKLSTEEYDTEKKLISFDLPYDCYISGSDQIWNTAPNDASMMYFLPFVKKGKRISYAPSFGQLGNIQNKDEISQYLMKYDFLSVRDEFGAGLVKELTGKEVSVLPDPTMLLEKQKWLSLINEKPLIEGEYMFFYTLFADREMIAIAKNISRQLHIPVVISNISNQYEIFSGFKKYLKCGPLEFLNLIYYARMVCTSSFHGTVFSCIMNKPFIAIRGMTDKRISTLLKKYDLKLNSIVSSTEINERYINSVFKTDFSVFNKKVGEEKEKALDFLKQALE